MTFYRKLRAAFIVLAFALWTPFMIMILFLAHCIVPKKKAAVLRFFHTGVCRIFKIIIQVKGQISEKPKTIYVANHASYIDIPVLGSILEGQFVAKSDVAQWPVIGQLAALQNTIYVERRASKAKKQNTILATTLSKGTNLIIFPEGTNTLGDEVKPFKSSLFGEDVLAEKPWIQPVAVAYSLPDGSSIPPDLRPVYGWPMTANFASHCWQLLQQGGMHVDVIFHDAFPCAVGMDRKELLNTAQKVVEHSVLKAIQ